MGAASSAPALRRTAVTAWLGLLVPLGGVAMALLVGRSDDDLGIDDPDVRLGFVGGAAIGLALWTIGMQRLASSERLVWRLLTAWPAAIGVFAVLQFLFDRGGLSAAVATVSALAMWGAAWLGGGEGIRGEGTGGEVGR